jgi:hypothetical protein
LPASEWSRIQAAGGAQVEIFQARILAHAGAAQPLRQRGIERRGVLAIDKEREAPRMTTPPARADRVVPGTPQPWRSGAGRGVSRWFADA